MNQARFTASILDLPTKAISKDFKPGKWFVSSVKSSITRGRLEFHHPDLFDLESEDEELKNAVVPIYKEGLEGLSSSASSKFSALHS